MTQKQCWKMLGPLFKEPLTTESFNQLRRSWLRSPCVFQLVYYSLLSRLMISAFLSPSPAHWDSYWAHLPSFSFASRAYTWQRWQDMFLTVKSSSHECSEGVGLKQLRLVSASEPHVSPVMLLRAKRQPAINPKLWTLLHNSAVTKQQFNCHLLS